MSLSKDQSDSLPKKALKEYLRLLQTRPIVTKACTSAFSGALGNILAQLITATPQGKSRLAAVRWRSVASFASLGFLMIGPVSHGFYKLLEKLIPTTTPHVAIKRLLFERLCFTPPFMFLYLYLLARFEGAAHETALQTLRMLYWTALKMNWKVWTVFIYINVTFIPAQYRVLFGNAISILWNIVLAIARKP